MNKNISFRSFAQIIFSCALVVACAAPVVSLAQAAQLAPQDMSGAVRAAIMQDPRAARMTPAQIDRLVNALTQKAQDEGMTPHDITYRPLPPEAMPDYSTSDKINTAVSAATCGNMPAFICAAERSLGIEGPRTNLFLILGLLAGALILIIGGIFHHHHKHGTQIA